MTTESIQPLNNLDCVKDVQQNEENPARKEYLDGRKFFTEGAYPQAAMAFHNALQGFEEQGDQVGVANASDRLGDACLARDEYAMAIANYQRAVAICTQKEDSFSLVALQKKMAIAYRALGDTAKALELFYDMLEHYRLTSNPKGAVEVLTVIADTCLEQGDRGQAVDALRFAASIHANFKHARLAAELRQRADTLEQGA